jgi:hypothetical protein
MPWVGLEPTIPASEQAKTVHARLPWPAPQRPWFPIIKYKRRRALFSGIQCLAVLSNSTNVSEEYIQRPTWCCTQKCRTLHNQRRENLNSCSTNDGTHRSCIFLRLYDISLLLDINICLLSNGFLQTRYSQFCTHSVLQSLHSWESVGKQAKKQHSPITRIYATVSFLHSDA